MSDKLDPELLAAVKAQVLQELKDEKTLAREEAAARRKEQQKERDEYVVKMKASPDPWVDIVGWSESEQGVKTELDWNDAFVDYLRAEGITGTDDEQVVQKWVTLLLRDMADQIDSTLTEDGEFSG